MGVPPETIGALLKAGVQAPSGDNMQPWRFHWDGDLLDLILDAKRDESLFNVRQLASFVALGAVVENLALAASTYGYRAELQYFPAGSSSDVVTRIQFHGGAEPGPLAAAIFERCVNRRSYDRRATLAPETIAAITNEATLFPGIGICWVTDLERRKRLAKIAARGDRLLFENPEVHGHLFSCIRWTQNEAERTRDGLPITTLELSGVDALMFPKLKHWSLVRRLNLLGLSRVAAMKSGALIRGSSAVGLITVPDASPEAFLQAGRAFQRVWLRATLEKLSFQPMTGFVLLQLRCLLGDHHGLTEEQVELLASTGKELTTVFAGVAGKMPALMFRIGKAKAPSGRTLRRELSEISNLS
jgi:nitroreductase